MSELTDNKGVVQSDDRIGCVIGRFQVHELHPAHHYVIKQAYDNHKRVIIFLGVARVLGTKKNSLDFITRKKMLEQDYPNATILPLLDHPDDYEWSREIDRRIREIYPINGVILYGSRDSFIPYYHGKFEVKELEQHTFVSGTEVRKKISEETKSSSDFRAGIIYNSYNQHPRVFPTVDIFLLNEEQDRVLVCRKPDEDKFRFIGGFLHPEDNSNEDGVIRIVKAKTNITTRKMEYVSSCKIDDWRYRGEEDKIVTTVYSTIYRNDETYMKENSFMSPSSPDQSESFGQIIPSDTISELTWVSINDVNESEFVNEHHPLLKILKQKYEI